MTTRLTYVIRIELSLIVVLLSIITIFSWPMNFENGDQSYNPDENRGVIQMEEVVRTEQNSSPPPPPKPMVPVPVPNDQIVPEDDLIIEDINLLDDPLALEKEGVGQGEEASKQGPVSNPQQPPKVQRIVEPTTPAEARRANIKVEMAVSMLVNKQGEVEDASVSEIRLYQNNGQYQKVDRIDYGLVDAVLKAAFQWKFKPAQQNGAPVSAYTKQIFSFGF